MREQDPRVPHEVEEYLVTVYAAAGGLGGAIGQALLERHRSARVAALAGRAG